VVLINDFPQYLMHILESDFKVLLRRLQFVMLTHMTDNNEMLSSSLCMLKSYCSYTVGSF
jgi:hypothetical protein